MTGFYLLEFLHVVIHFKMSIKYVLNVSELSQNGFVDIGQHFIATVWVNLPIKFS